jgi:branched-chain amino acid transport system substrate-binding protein
VKFVGMRRGAVLGMAVLTSVALAACGGGDDGGGGGGGGSDGPIKIAMTGPLTGDNAAYGQDQLEGMQLAVDQFNEAGGVQSGPNEGRQLELISRDDAGDPNQGASVAQELCDDTDVMAVLGPVNSSVALAVGPIYNRCGLTEITSYASNPEITLKGFENVFRSIPNDDQLSAADVAAAVEIAGAQTIAIVYSNDDYGTGLYDGAVAAAEEYGVEIVAAESFTPGSTRDFSSILTNVRGSNPDAVLMMTTYSDAGLLVNQARQVGIEGQLVVPTGSNVPEFLELAGEAAEGVLTPVLFDVTSEDPEIAEFVEAFRAAFDRDPGESSATGYASMQLIQYALNEGATTREEISEKLTEGEEMETILGPITFNENRDPSSLTSLIILTVQDGAFVASEQQLSS